MPTLFPMPASRCKLSISIALALASIGCATQDEVQDTALINPDIARIYFNSTEAQPDYVLQVWNDQTCDGYMGDNTDWKAGLEPSGQDPDYGVYWDLQIDPNAECVNFTPHRFNPDYQTSALKLRFSDNVNEGAKVGYVFKDTNRVFYTPSTTPPETAVSLKGANSHWISPSLILVPKNTTEAELVMSTTGGMSINERDNLIEGTATTLTLAPSSASAWQQDYPHLTDEFAAFEIKEGDSNTIANMIRGQIWLVSYADEEGARALSSVTRVQTAELLDSLYADEATKLEYGAVIDHESDTTTFRLWAPTAQQVKLIPFDEDLRAQTPILMRRDNASGSWLAEYTELAHGDFYRYEVTLYHPETGRVETLQVTDPYSLSLSTNSQHSQVVDLDSSELKPAGWDELSSPVSQENPASFMIYETHVRDFSALDESTTDHYRGKYLAFTEGDSLPVTHLKSLSRRGATHLHLMPVFDFATVNEELTERADINESFRKLCQMNPNLIRHPKFGLYCDGGLSGEKVLEQFSREDSLEAPVVQELSRATSQNDSYNWGYDPYHYSIPEGSYATEANGMQRIVEFRKMIMAIKSDIKMNVVMDVVYNHTNESGMADKSVLDKIVPNYYHRLDPVTGEVEESTCCSNTAPERQMMEKLITDSVVVWAKDYKVDAFRWDLMGHHPKSQILATLDAAKEVNPEVYFYGEGWDFGEVKSDSQFQQASQLNLYGTGIGTFSDRMRDAVRGGSPFDKEEQIRASQGFGNGAFVYPNELNKVDEAQAKHLADIVRLGMAGNLRDFSFTDSQDRTIKGSELEYNDEPAGYAKDAWEIINYVEKHDNQTLWDNHQYKTPFDADLNTRIRMHATSLATVMYGQNVVFHHMGSELLRSKSMERNSYDSGDWYNRVDFTKQSNNWNVGLPSADEDEQNWALIENIYKNTEGKLDVSPRDIATMERFFKEMMEIRTSSPLFTLGDGREISQRIKFHNTGSNQLPGLIVMSIDDRAPFENLDPQRKRIVVVINARNDIQTIDQLNMSSFKPHRFHSQLGPFSLANGTEMVDDVAIVPPWSAVVFEER
ncbi:type II secretion protein [Vibrio breoganii]|uniref:pullulanase-type alpha-1,6-glucosidase n=1 Tax=Vibrio breoganii TaxID=553239 RepID=UPI0002EAEAEB|nr:pullulanase-type alpha-1,6-glucosidase [Vibrio breoganii]OED93927.1 type II secretion protein [Vibrio breoganii ZF-29]PMG00751.1 type II secretion protein [Vibrio breoganii]PML37426.1 type II secretion protein [Vibrio breoganii]PMO76649.1 type II secretion protein [Vibrio breoganii]PMO89533.1 type II secretion protein [Vibrio breoganii]